jgi:hypothetical protein
MEEPGGIWGIMSKITIVCVLRTPVDINHKEKQKVYSGTDVLKLKKAFEKFLTIEHEFVCLSDQQIKGVDTVSLIGDTPGWWAKIELFRPALFSTPVLYIDLDMVICNELDSLIEQCQGNKFLMLKDPKAGTPGSGLMYWEGQFSNLWSTYCKDSKKIQEEYRRKPKIGDQAFIADNVDYSFFVDQKNIKKEWFCALHFTTVPHPDSKILICMGQGNKLHRKEYESHEWVNKFWRNL